MTLERPVDLSRGLSREELDIAVAHAIEVHDLASAERERVREATDLATLRQILSECGLPANDIDRAIATLPAVIGEHRASSRASANGSFSRLALLAIGGVGLTGLVAIGALFFAWPRGGDASTDQRAEPAVRATAAGASDPRTNPPEGMGVARGATDGVSASQSSTFNEALGLPPYPGATAVVVKEKGKNSEVTFRSSDTLRTIYDFYHARLTADGWERVAFEQEHDELEGTYQRGSSRFELEIETKGGGGYELEIDWK